MMFSNLFEPGQIGKMKVKNRIVFAAIDSASADLNGCVTPLTIHHYVERAKGGVGLITVEINYTEPRGKWNLHQLSMANDGSLAGHRDLVYAIHAYGTKVACQLHHTGRMIHCDTGYELVAPSGQYPSMNPQFPEGRPRELTIPEIYGIIQSFAEAAARAKKAGYDAVELHGAHGYLINEFMSPHSNKRMDEFGGDVKGKMKFPVEIVKAIKEKAGDDFPVIFKMNGADFSKIGLTLEDTKIQAKMLVEAGADAIDVSAGTYATIYNCVPSMQYKEGFRVYLAEGIKKTVDVPVFCVGGLVSPEFCEEILRDGKADFVELGRALIADPEWPNKAKEGRVEDIRKCISCNVGCFLNLVLQDHTRCTINAAEGSDAQSAEIKPAERIKNVMIIGGGPAGMEAARVTALRGHRVTLYEKEKELGGQLKLAGVPPGKAKINWFKDWLINQIKKSKVEVKLGSTVTAETVEKAKPDAVIIATGARPIAPEVPGIESEKVVQAWDVLSGKVALKGKKAVVVGGGMVGCETALFLADKGNKVTILTRRGRDELGGDMEPLAQMVMLEQIRAGRGEETVSYGVREFLPGFNVDICENADLAEIVKEGAVVTGRAGNRSVIEADKVVLARGTEPVSELENKLRDKVRELYIVGDSYEPRQMLDAISEGFRVARII